MEPLLYNSRIIDTYIRLIKSRYNQVDVSELLKYADMKPYQVADQGHWFTQSQIDRFYEKLVYLTGNKEIAREAGRFAASPEALGAMRQYALGLIGPANTFELINKATSNFTKSSTYHSKKLSSNKVEIVVTPLEGVVEQPFQCENRIGFFEAIVLMFKFKLPKIQHEECVFKGGKACRYTISWEKSYTKSLKSIGLFVVLLFIAAMLYLVIAHNWIQVELLLQIFVPVICGLILAVIISEHRELKASLENTKESTDKLIEQIDINYNNALMTNEIGQLLNTSTNRQDIIANVILIMEKRLDYDRGLIFLANIENNKLVLKAGYGYSAKYNSLLESTSFNIDRPESRGVFSVSFREQKPFLINNLNDIEDSLSHQSLEFARNVGTKSFICCPIVCDGKSIGIIAVDNVNTKKPLVQSDISRLLGVASVIGISLRNADLIESRVRQFNSVLQVLAASIDARDSMTAGHSEKVTEYSVGICNELNLSSDETETIRVAALLHDYGKIGVPDAILKKDGILNAEEYEIVKTHAAKTKEILSRINFEGIYCSVPEIAGAHHEKIDGSGYPNGLLGHEVPIGSRIIAVADYFEAITAKRHYREPMAVENAFQSLFDAGGRKFDKRIVDAFLSYYSKEYQFVPFNADELDPFIERRKRRIPTKVPVTFWVDGRNYTGKSEDLSIKGVYLASEELFPKGHPVDLFISLPGSSKAIEALGRVAWVNKGPTDKKFLPTGFGMEFLEFKDMAERILEDFINRSLNNNCAQECG